VQKSTTLSVPGGGGDFLKSQLTPVFGSGSVHIWMDTAFA